MMNEKQRNDFRVVNGNNMDVLDTLPDNYADSIVTDPPYELNFMGKGWDNTGIAYNVELWKKALRVLKPGGHLLAFGGSRTFHRIAVAIEDAGFEIRDCIMWLYGSGFPKSMNVGKSVESKLVNGSASKTDFKNLDGTKEASWNWGITKANAEQGFRPKDYCDDGHLRTVDVDYKTEEGKKWDGWGTALKPAFEPIIMARKPVDGTIAENCLKWGVGGINIDECRVGNEHFEITDDSYDNNENQSCFGNIKRTPKSYNGRFPANIITDGSDEVAKGMPNSKSSSQERHNSNESHNNKLCYGKYNDNISYGFADEGSALRYFYSAKASKKDRDEGLDLFNEKIVNDGRKTSIDNAFQRGDTLRRNIHPTVKPCELMQYLVRLVTPRGGLVMDIFNGSGSTGKATAFENRERDANYRYLGIELSKEYADISLARIDYALNKYEYDIIECSNELKKRGQMSLFDLLEDKK